MRHVILPLRQAALVTCLLFVAGCALIETTEPDEPPLRRTRVAAPEAAQPDEDIRAVKQTATLEDTPLDATTPAPPTPADSVAVAATGEAASNAGNESVLGIIGTSTTPNVAAALRLIEDGRLLLEHERYDQARERFERAVSIDPTSLYGYYFLAQVSYRQQNYAQASAFAGRAAGLAARADPAWQARISALQGAVYEAIGRYPEARQAYQQAMRVDPSNAAARNALARLSVN
jgi:tetratricopeptide (TPR) repeat protein